MADSRLRRNRASRSQATILSSVGLASKMDAVARLGEATQQALPFGRTERCVFPAVFDVRVDDGPGEGVGGEDVVDPPMGDPRRRQPDLPAVGRPQDRAVGELPGKPPLEQHQDFPTLVLVPT